MIHNEYGRKQFATSSSSSQDSTDSRILWGSHQLRNFHNVLLGTYERRVITAWLRRLVCTGTS